MVFPFVSANDTGSLLKVAGFLSYKKGQRRIPDFSLRRPRKISPVSLKRHKYGERFGRTFMYARRTKIRCKSVSRDTPIFFFILLFRNVYSSHPPIFALALFLPAASPESLLD